MDPSDKVRPSFSKCGTLLGGQARLVAMSRTTSIGGLLKAEFSLISMSPRSGGIEAPVMDAMFSGLWDLGEDSGDKVKDVECLTLGM